jgi:hypothetical protein
MSTTRRFLCSLVCLVAVSLAIGQDTGTWGSMRYVRLDADRIVVFSKGITYDLQHDVGWDIADTKQKQQFESWVKKAGLPKDMGQFVTDLPPERQVPVAAEILVGSSAVDQALISLKFKTDPPATVTLTHKTGWRIATEDRDSFKQFAEKLHVSTPTLLVALSGGGKPSEEDAWNTLMQRASTQTGFVTPLGGYKYAVWSHTSPSPISAPSDGAKPKPKASSPKAGADESSSGGGWVLPTAIGGVVILCGGVAFGVPGVRKRLLGGVAPNASVGPAAFPVGSHERELILKVREEGRRKPQPANAPYSEEEYAVGMMLDKYRSYDTVVQDRDQAQKRAESLQAYKEYQEKYEAFEKRYSAATEALARREAELATEQTARKDLQEKLRQADTYVKQLQQEQTELAKSLQEAEALVREMGEWSKTVTDRLNAQAAKIHHE